MSKIEQPQLQASDFNLCKINTKEYSEIIRSAIDIGSDVAVFGLRGSGKTEIAKAEIANFKRDQNDNSAVKEVYINLSTAERTDMGGYPDMFGIMRTGTESEKRQRFVDIILPQFFQPLIEGDQPCVALLDEMDKADPSIYAPLLEIVQFKSINGRPLKNLRSCIMTGNLISEGGARPCPPLLDRSEKYLIEPDASLWLSWASRSGKIHPSVTAFINDKNTELYASADLGDNYADKSPRGWYNASRALFMGEARGWTQDLLLKKVSGFVGKTAGLSYQIYFEHYQVLLPLVKKLFEGQNINKEYLQQDPSHQLLLCMIACSRLAGLLDVAKANKSGMPECTDHIGKFLENAGPENILVAVRTQLSTDRIVQWQLDEYKSWKDILTNTSDML